MLDWDFVQVWHFGLDSTALLSTVFFSVKATGEKDQGLFNVYPSGREVPGSFWSGTLLKALLFNRLHVLHFFSTD